MCYASIAIDTQEEVIWKEIPGFPDYLISSEGDIWDEKKRLFKIPFISFYGYPCIHLRNKKNLLYIYHLVWETFQGARKKKLVINHKDGNKLNSNINNLEEISKSEDVKHAWKMGLHEKTREQAKVNIVLGWKKCWKLNQEKANKIRELHNQGIKNKQLAQMFEISGRQIRDIVKGIYWNNNKGEN